MVFQTSSVEQTEELAARLGALLAPGTVLALWGGLGAGKTAFVRGLARGMGVRGRVSSPTFTLMRQHEGPIKLIHFDLYRLSPEGSEELALDEWFGGPWVCAVEWPQNAGELLPEERLDVALETQEETERQITVTSRGAGYERVIEGLQR